MGKEICNSKSVKHDKEVAVLNEKSAGSHTQKNSPIL